MRPCAAVFVSVSPVNCPGTKGHQRADGGGEEQSEEHAPGTDGGAQHAQRCKTGDVEQAEDRKNHHLFLCHDGGKRACPESLDQHDDRQLLSQDAENEGNAHG